MSFRPESENYKYWTKEEDEKITHLISLGTPIAEMAKELKRSYSSCASRSSFLKIKNTYSGPKKYEVDENFWSEFNPINCYYGGILAADGNMMLANKNFEYVGTVKWELSNIDLCLLNDFKNRIKYNGPIRSYNNRSALSSISISSREWNKDLINKFNIVPNKTFRIKPPNDISDELFFCWLIGYIDGDGMIYYDNFHDSLHIKITSSSEYIVKYIYDFLLTRFPQKIRNKSFSTPKKLKHANCWEVSILGIRAVCLFSYLKQYNLPKLKRKWEQEKVLVLEQKMKDSYPNFFNFENLPKPL